MKRFKSSICRLALCFIFPASFVMAVDEGSKTISEIKKHAEAFSNAQRRLDFDAFIPYVPVKLLEFMGGREGLAKTMKDETEELKRRGVTINSVTIGTPQEPKVHEGVQVALVPQKLVVTTPQGRLVTDLHLLAISENHGKDWVFVDTASINDQKLGILYPALKGKVEIPPMKTKPAEQ